MISPFALYYYSAYGVPLNALAAQPSTSWLVQHILPHFATHDSTLGHVLIAISWPLVFVGLVLFVIGFVQIYWAKFTGKGAVAIGLYRWVRHPQYIALALVGLGATLFWSRFLIVIAFVTMLFLYYWLARYEERRCLEKFGDAYADYLASTGRFLPRFRKAKADDRVALADTPSWRGIAIQTSAWLFAVAIAVVGGFALKHHVAASLLRLQADGIVMLSLAPLDDINPYWRLVHNNREILQARKDLASDAPLIIYLAPASWSIPELGLQPSGDYAISSRDELLHPSHHGNSPEFDASELRLLFTRAEGELGDGDILMQAIGVTPLFAARISDGEVAAIDRDPDAGSWRGIPVPIY
ncbi:MAG: isoprenylcysteine carboxylmethyltransferase family protein [Gammaproteobacteria bacterium]|nr:isoprenylcysteine carboxylmethyltransferase family protein [Gammaproteobacteria bacterium]